MKTRRQMLKWLGGLAAAVPFADKLFAAPAAAVPPATDGRFKTPGKIKAVWSRETSELDTSRSLCNPIPLGSAVTLVFVDDLSQWDGSGDDRTATLFSPRATTPLNTLGAAGLVGHASLLRRLADANYTPRTAYLESLGPTDSVTYRLDGLTLITRTPAPPPDILPLEEWRDVGFVFDAITPVRRVVSAESAFYDRSLGEPYSPAARWTGGLGA